MLRVITEFTKTVREEGLIDEAWIPVFPSIDQPPPALSEDVTNPRCGSTTEVLPEAAEDVEMGGLEEDEMDEGRDDTPGKGSDAG